MTAQAEELFGDEVYGRPAAFFAAGARQILGSLWPLDNDTGPAVMGDFHTGFASSQPAETALQAAVIRQRRAGLSFYHWAPYKLITLGRPAAGKPSHSRQGDLMNGTTALRLAFHIESPGDVAESLTIYVAQIDGVENVEIRPLGPARGIDAQSMAEILVLVTATTRAGVTVTGHIAEIISNMKKIAAESGLTRIYVERKRKKEDVNLLGDREMAELAEEAVNRASSAGK